MDNSRREFLEQLTTGAALMSIAPLSLNAMSRAFAANAAPGTSILVRTAEPAADQFTVAIEKVGERAISEKAAAGLFVRPS